MTFNPHGNKTADGHLIVGGLAVFTNDMTVGKVATDWNSLGCCDNPDHNGQKRVEGAVYTDHDAGECAGRVIACRHDHWFSVEVGGIATGRYNGERLSTTFQEYSGNVKHAVVELATTGPCDGEGNLPRSMGETLPDGTVTGLCISCQTFQPMIEVIPPSKPEWPREFRLAEHEKGTP